MRRLTDEEWPEMESPNGPMVGCFNILPLVILFWVLLAVLIWRWDS